MGKTLLADLIRDTIKPTTGTVEVAGPLLGQNKHFAFINNETVADLHGVAAKLNAH